MAKTRRRPYPRAESLTAERPESRYGARGNARGKNVRRKETTPAPTTRRGGRRHG